MEETMEGTMEGTMEETMEGTMEKTMEGTIEKTTEETIEETISPPALINSLRNNFAEENSWKCIKGKCPIQSYGIWLKYSTHGVALIKRLIPENYRADPNVDQSGPDGGGIITDADGYQHTETGVSYGEKSNGNRIDPHSTTFTYTGRAVGVKYPDNEGGKSYKSGTATINIQNSQTNQPVQVLIKLQDEPQWDWNYSDGLSDMVLVDGSFSYDKPGSVTERLEGQYYGPNHEEFGGIFIRDGWYGAYGGSQQ